MCGKGDKLLRQHVHLVADACHNNNKKTIKLTMEEEGGNKLHTWVHDARL